MATSHRRIPSREPLTSLRYSEWIDLTHLCIIGSTVTHSIRAIESTDLDEFIAYLEDQLQDNGRDGTPLFHPQSRSTQPSASEKADLFRLGFATPVGEAK